MKQAKAGRVPVIESAVELNLAKLKRAAHASGAAQLVLTDGDVRTVVALSTTRLAAFLDGRTWLADIVAVPCLKGRLRPLFRCPRAHEGNFQSLYFYAGALACRNCHGLRYRSTLAATPAERSRLARLKLLARMGGAPGDATPPRPPGSWRKRYRRLAARLAVLTGAQFEAMHASLQRMS